MNETVAMTGYTKEYINKMTESELIELWKDCYQYNIEVRHGKIEKDLDKKDIKQMTKEEFKKYKEELKKLYNWEG